MKPLEGIHHITAITADSQSNLDFYAGVLGLRLVKKTVNQDNPGVYHLFYADQKGSAGSDITFFEYPGLPPGRAGDGMVHLIRSRVADERALDFWTERLAGAGVSAERGDASLRFADPEGLGHELVAVETDEEPLIAEHPDIPAEFALRGFDGVRAYSSDPAASSGLLEAALGFARGDGADSWVARGEARSGTYDYDAPPPGPGMQGAGTVHHVAWASQLDELDGWREAALGAGAQATPLIDRFYFRSIYFREPSGVLFELATLGPGFTVDEPEDSLGERLSLPPDFEHLREQVEPTLRPLVSPRASARG